MKFTLILIFLLQIIGPVQDGSKIKIRNLYEEAAVKEDSYIKLNELLTASKTTNYLINCYKGANLMISAKYTFNPIAKINKFNKGKNLIERSIDYEPNHVEIRYIRFTIQTNLPKFLGYHDEINKDKEFLINQLANVTDIDLRNRLVAYLLSSKRCSEAELKKVIVWKNK